MPSSRPAVHQSYKASSISSGYSGTSSSYSGGQSGQYSSYESGVHRESGAQEYETLVYPSQGNTIIDHGKRVYDNSPPASYRRSAR